MWFEFKYTNGETLEKFFNNVIDLNWFVHNEGDHLLDYIPIAKDLKEPKDLKELCLGSL